MGADSAIIVAVITAVGGVVVAFVNRGRKENKDDHAHVVRRLDEVASKVDNISKVTVGHLRWHTTQSKKKKGRTK